MARILVVFLTLTCSFFCLVAVGARELDKMYEKIKLGVGPRTITAYVADDDQRRESGLMFVEKMDDNTGMLFVFDSPRPLHFWMKNTLIPLSIGFFDEKGALIDAQEMKIAGSLLAVEVPTYHSKSSSLFALEMNPGWFSRNKILPGDRLRLQSKVKSKLLKETLAGGTSRQ